MNRKVLGFFFAIILLISLIYFLRQSSPQTDQVIEDKTISTVQNSVAIVPTISQSIRPGELKKHESKQGKENERAYDKDMQDYLERKKKARVMVEKWQPILAKQPDGPEALGNMAYALIGMVELEEAVRLSEKCLEIDSKNELCHTVRYFATDSLDNTSTLNDLLPLLEECLAAIPGHYRCLSEIVQNHLMASKIDKAEEYLVRMEKFHPGKILTVYRRAMYYLVLKDYERTRQYLRKACDMEGLDSFIAADYSIKDVACSQLDAIKDYR